MLFRSQLESRLNEARTDFTSASAEHDAAKAGRSRLPDGNETAQRVATLQQSSEKARLALSPLQAEQTMTDRSMGAARDRLSSAQSEVRRWSARAGEAARPMEDMAKRTPATSTQQHAPAGNP